MLALLLLALPLAIESRSFPSNIYPQAIYPVGLYPRPVHHPYPIGFIPRPIHHPCPFALRIRGLCDCNRLLSSYKLQASSFEQMGRQNEWVGGE